MKMLKVNRLSALTLVMMLGISFPAMANVGRVLYTFGVVNVEKPAISTLRRGGIVEEGDVIVTGPKGYAQLKLADGTKIAVRPNSRFVIEAFEAPATATTPAIGTGSTLKASFNLQKGGFRTITGKIAQRDPSAYQVRTPSAVIRVRGTNYLTRSCAGDCGPDTEDGLYVGVSDGGVTMSNDAGDLNLADNQYGFAQSFNTPPTRLVAPPSSLQEEGLTILEEEADEEGDESDEGGSEESDETTEESSDESEGGSEEGGDGGSDDGAGDGSGDGSSDGSGGDSGSSSGDGSGTSSGGGSAASGSSEAVATTRSGTVSKEVVQTTTRTSTTTTTTGVTNDNQPDQEITAAGSGGQNVDLTAGDETFVGRGLAFSLNSRAVGINTNNETVTVSAANNLTRFDDIATSGQVTSYRLGTAQNRNAGFDPVSNIKWGRWSQGAANQTVGATQTPVDLSNKSLHWVLISEDEVIPAQVITGSASYTLVGNTDPTDGVGNVGVLGSADFSADFTNSTVQSSLQLGINNQNWTASGTGQITANLFNGLYSTVTVNGVSGGNGSFGGAFGGYGTTGVPAGAGMAYRLTNGSVTVNGAAVFNNAGTEQ